MSGGESGVMTSREAYGSSGGGLHHSGQPQPAVQNMRVAYGSDGGTVYKPMMSMSPSYQGSSGNGGAIESAVGLNNGINMDMGSGKMMKKKRGRPRKYGPDGAMPFSVVSPIQAVPVATQTPAIFSQPQPTHVIVPPESGPLSPTSVKKRGRPPGSTNKKKREPRGPTGIGFIPHIISVKIGEDVSAKILSFSQHGSRAVCILSASGAISNVTLRQPATSGGTVTCEGRFEILSLSGSFFLTESDGQRTRSGGMTVSLSGPDGRVMGGGVAGLLVAASPVQVIVGTFNVDSGNEKKKPRQKESTPVLHNEPLVGITTGASSSPSGASLSESSSGGGSGSPLNQHGMGIPNNNNNIPQGMPWK